MKFKKAGLVTELEACVLAVIWRDQPCTAYQIRIEFERSLASSWRASTGSIYPLVRRMTLQGLIECASVSSDRRGTRLIKTTAAGRSSVKKWLGALPDWAGDATEDPIRTRVHFLALLSERKRPVIIEQMIAATKQSLLHVDKHITAIDATKDKMEWLVHRGARAMIHARLKWLKDVQRTFKCD